MEHVHGRSTRAHPSTQSASSAVVIGCRVLAHDTPPEALAGVVAALAGDFGVSDRFIAVRLQRYRLIEGGRL